MAVVPLIEAFLSQVFSPPIVRKMALGFVSGVGLGLVVVSACFEYSKLHEKSINL